MRPKNKFPLFIGTYTENTKSDGIYFCLFDTEQGKIEKKNLAAEISNPSYLIFDENRNVIFSVSETSDFSGHIGGSVSSFSIQDDMQLKLIGSQPTLGKAPCHLCLSRDGKTLFAANYAQGSLSIFPVSPEGMIEPLIQTVQHEGNGPNQKRQEQAHVHFASSVDKGVCVADLGMDKIFWYTLSNGELLKESDTFTAAASISMPPGSGPRHFVFHPIFPLLYIVQELSNQVISVQLDKNGYPLEINQIISTLPETFQGDSTCAAIRINKEGTLLFVSNRGHDSVAVYRIDNHGMMTKTGIYSCGGETPRDICLSPDEKWLLCANQSGEISVLPLDEKTGVLSKSIWNEPIDCPVNLLFF